MEMSEEKNISNKCQYKMVVERIKNYYSQLLFM